MGEYEANAEQRAFLDDVRSGGGNTILSSRAGTGKTRTILESLAVLPHSLRRNTVLIAFSSDIAAVLKKRAPAGVDVKTLHALGLRACAKAWGWGSSTDNVDKYKGQNTAAAVSGADRDSSLREWSHCLHRVTSMCKSVMAVTDGEIDGVIDRLSQDHPGDPSEVWRCSLCARQEPRLEGYDRAGPCGSGGCGGTMEEAEDVPRLRFVEQVKECLERATYDLAPSDVEEGQMDRVFPRTIDFDDMCYLPVRMRLKMAKYDRVFCDEAQDLNKVQHYLVVGSLAREGRFFGVGDPYQCHPAGERVLVSPGMDVPIEDLKDGDAVMGWNRQSQKMIGGRKVRVGTRPFRGTMHKLTVLGYQGEGSPTTRVTSNHRLLCRWTDRKSRTCVTYLMWREGFGFRVGWCQLFSGKDNTLHLRVRANQEKADRVWILAAHASRTSASVHESIVAARWGIPTVTYEPVNGAEHLTAESIGQIFEAVRETNYASGFAALEAHGRKVDYPLLPWPEKGGGSYKRATYFEVHAANVIPGLMSVPLPGGVNRWSPVISNETATYEGLVYSLDVEKDHSYSAGGLVVLNSIYRWRGAMPDSLARLGRELDAKELKMTMTYRCGKAIVREAQKIVPDFQAGPDQHEGEVVEGVTPVRMMKEARAGDFILSRTNAPLLGLCLGFLREGRRANIKGRDIGQKLAALVRRAKAKSIPELRGWVDEWAEKESERLVSKGDSPALIQDIRACLSVMIANCPDVYSVEGKIARLFDDEDDASRITLATTHRAKGMERERVWLLRDTYRPNGNDEERCLLYVGVTRAIQTLFMVKGAVQGDEE